MACGYFYLLGTTDLPEFFKIGFSIEKPIFSPSNSADEGNNLLDLTLCIFLDDMEMFKNSLDDIIPNSTYTEIAEESISYIPPESLSRLFEHIASAKEKSRRPKVMNHWHAIEKARDFDFGRDYTPIDINKAILYYDYASRLGSHEAAERLRDIYWDKKKEIYNRDKGQYYSDLFKSIKSRSAQQWRDLVTRQQDIDREHGREKSFFQYSPYDIWRIAAQESDIQIANLTWPMLDRYNTDSDFKYILQAHTTAILYSGRNLVNFQHWLINSLELQLEIKHIDQVIAQIGKSPLANIDPEAGAVEKIQALSILKRYDPRNACGLGIHEVSRTIAETKELAGEYAEAAMRFEK